MKNLVIAMSCLCFCANGSFAAIVPTYQVTEADATWSHLGNGIYSVATSAEDYDTEVWERPVLDNKWFDDGFGTRFSGTAGGGGEYWAWNDLDSASWGIGTTMGEDYLFVRWIVMGDFKHVAGESNGISEGLKGHYYFYARPDGLEAFAIQVPDAVGLAGSFTHGDNAGKVNIFDDANGDVTGTGITTTGENGGDSFGNIQVKGVVRANGTTTVEVAVLLSDLGLTMADFDTAADWAYAGVANTNPSDPNTNLFANDFFPEAAGSGQEYDTVMMGTTVPEPGSLLLLGIGGLALLKRSRRGA